jgi:hypothetical protein
MKPSVGLIAMWTGEICANVDHMRHMAIHQMTDAELDQFANYVRDLSHSASSLSKYIQQTQEQA